MIKMPTVFSPDYVFMAKSSKALLSRMKINLSKICQVQNQTSLINRIQRSDQLKWKTNYAVDVMDLCSIELVQVQGMFMTEEAAPPSDKKMLKSDFENGNRLTMYMLIFKMTTKHHERTNQINDMFNNICKTAISGLPQEAQF